MIYSTITHYNECCFIGNDDDSFHESTKNTITFDSEALIIQAEKTGGEGELCTIMFQLSPQLIKELKNIISTIEIQEMEQ